MTYMQGINIVIGNFKDGSKMYSFNGYLELGPEDFLMDSLLIDEFGNSRVSNFKKGSDELSFTRTYFPTDSDYFENFSFKLVNKLWVGGYTDDDNSKNREATLLLSPVNVSKEPLIKLLLSVYR